MSTEGDQAPPAGTRSRRPRSRRPWWRSRWWMPAFSLALGAIIFVAFALGGDIGTGAISAGVFVVVAAVFAFARRSETLQGLGGPSRDERWAMIDLRATAFAGVATILTVIAAWLWEIAHGRDGSPYTELAAVGGAAYVVGVAVLRRRG